MKQKTMKRNWTALFVILLLVVLFTSCSSGEDKKNESDSSTAYFTISNEYCTYERGWLIIHGTVTNNCDVPVSDMRIRYDIYGDDGNPTRDWGLEPANEWQLYYLPLEPGESEEFDVRGEISERTNGVTSFKFADLSCSFDQKTDYKRKEAVGYVTREVSEQLVAEAKK